MTTTNKPAHKVRIGLNSISIFKNVTQNGNAMYKAQFERSYKDADGWKQTRSFGLDDLCVQAELIEHAKAWIYEQLQADAQSESYENAA